MKTASSSSPTGLVFLPPFPHLHSDGLTLSKHELALFYIKKYFVSGFGAAEKIGHAGLISTRLPSPVCQA
jgi:hypothetical protein